MHTHTHTHSYQLPSLFALRSSLFALCPAPNSLLLPRKDPKLRRDCVLRQVEAICNQEQDLEVLPLLERIRQGRAPHEVDLPRMALYDEEAPIADSGEGEDGQKKKRSRTKF